MNNPNMTLAQIRQVGLEVLARHLGPVGMVRFLQHSDQGFGNYTEERHQWLENKDVNTLAAEIMAKRGEQ
jgi:hypothetical protein